VVTLAAKEREFGGALCRLGGLVVLAVGRVSEVVGRGVALEAKSVEDGNGVSCTGVVADVIAPALAGAGTVLVALLLMTARGWGVVVPADMWALGPWNPYPFLILSNMSP